MRLSLNGSWKATQDLGQQARAGKPGYDADSWPNVPVPGHWQQASGFGQHAGRLLYRRSFGWDRALGEGDLVRLVFEGIFYDAKVWLNGTFLGEHRGYFVPALYDVTRHLRPGENVVMLEVDAPAEEDLNNKRQITGVFSHWDCKAPGTEPGGIWRDVYVEVYPGIVPERLTVRAVPDRLPPAPMATEEVAKGDAPVLVEGPVTADVQFELEFAAASEQALSWTATVTPETFEGDPVTLTGSQPARRGWNRLSAAVSLTEPRLWWSWDHGRPDLYRLTLDLKLGDGPPYRIERLFGVRKIELRKYHFYLNGRRIFIRGTNYGPADMRLASVKLTDVRRDLTLMREANMNMVRLHAHINKPDLYEEASRQGLLLWQDFPLQWLYSRSILDEAKRQARAMVDLLGHWPAIAVWCCHNEPYRYGDRDDPGILDRSMTFLSAVTGNWNKSTLDPALRDVIRAADPTRPCLAHSGDWGGMRGGSETHHYWGWYSGRMQDLKKVLKTFPDSARFVTEYGAQSFPIPENSRKFVKGQWPNLNWGELRERYMLQTKVMERNIPHTAAKTFEEYAEATQRYQATLHKYFNEHFRRLKYKPCGGVLQFMFTDAAPGVSWSIVDYWRAPKAAYEAVKGSFSPLYIMTDWPEPEYPTGARITLQVFLLNDRYTQYKGTWSWSLEREGEVLATAASAAYLTPDCLLSVPGGLDWTIPETLAPGPADLVLRLELEGEPPVENRYSLTITPSQPK